MRRIALSVALLTLVSCSGENGGGTTPTQPVTPVATTIEVSSSSITLESLGATSTLTATVKDQNGAAMAGQAVSWASSDDAIATVANGTVTAVANGSATVTAEVGAVSARATVTVQQVPATLGFVLDSLVLDSPGDSASFALTVADDLGSAILSPVVTWASSDSTVVTVSSSGVGIAEGSGSALVSAVVDGLMAQLSVRVRGSFALVTVLGDGDPIDGVVVFLTLPDSTFVRDTTGVDGHVAFRSLGTGTHAVTLQETPTGYRTPPPVTFSSGLDSAHVVLFDASFAPARITGTALAWGEPVAGATVVVEGVDTVLAVTDGGGGFLVDSIRQGDYSVSIRDHAELAVRDSVYHLPFTAGTTYEVDFWMKPTGRASKWVALGVTSNGSCGVTEVGKAYCWGGSPHDERFWAPWIVRSTNSYVDIVLDQTRAACAATASGAVDCWRLRADGDEPGGRAEPGPFPEAIASLRGGRSGICGVTSVETGYCGFDYVADLAMGVLQRGQADCAISTDQLLYCKTDGTWLAVLDTVMVADFDNKSDSHSCAVAVTGSGFCWGTNDEGQLGTGTFVDSATPVAVAGGLSFSTIRTSDWSGVPYSCGLTVFQQAYCWGSQRGGLYGTLGSPVGALSNVPVPVQGGFSFTDIDVGGGHACAISVDGDAYCWGYAYDGELGTGTQPSTRDYPLRVGGVW